MKKPSALFAAVAFSFVFASTTFFAESTFAQPPKEHGAPKISEERAAELNRPLVPRGEKMGLLLAFHGAPSPNWTKLTGEIVEKVRDLNAKTPVFGAVDGADMEFNPNNDVVSGFGRLEKAGCDYVVVLPAFIYPTSHVQFDVVSILGLYSDAKMRDQLKEEGIRTVRTKLPTTVAPTFATGELLKNFVVSEAKSISTDAKNERLLVIAHGDEEYAGLVDRLTEPALDAARELGFDEVRSAFCEMGQSFAKNVQPIVEQNTKDGKKTLIVAIYLASSAKSFVERVGTFGQTDAEKAAISLDGLNFECSTGRLGDFKETPDWIFETARAASVF